MEPRGEGGLVHLLRRLSRAADKADYGNVSWSVALPTDSDIHYSFLLQQEIDTELSLLIFLLAEKDEIRTWSRPHNTLDSPPEHCVIHIAKQTSKQGTKKHGIPLHHRHDHASSPTRHFLPHSDCSGLYPQTCSPQPGLVPEE